jgi:N utilization substance protein A
MNIDPIGACVGVRGNRVQAIIQELQGEKIDIILWSDDLATFAVNALAPAEVTRVVMDEENRKFEVLAPDNQLSLAIGRRGQNVRLASMLIGCSVTVVSETFALEQRNKEYHLHSQTFMDALDCDEVIAHLLVTEGFETAEELADCPVEELASINGFDEDIAQELISRAKDYLQRKKEESTQKMKSMKIDKKIIALGLLSDDMILALAEKKVLKLDELADLCADELMEILPGMDQNLANEVIMKSRAHWFE